MPRFNPLETQDQAQAAIAEMQRRQRQEGNSDQFFGGDRRVFILSPDGHYWEITVDNAGVLATVDFGTEHPSQ